MLGRLTDWVTLEGYVNFVPEHYRNPLPSPMLVLEELLLRAGLTLVEATLRYSFFIAPEAVRARCPWFPNRSRMSRQHFPLGDCGDRALWREREVTLGHNFRGNRPASDVR
ncbi:MAG: hypothetical protein EOO71_16220 [Myxococcaceae bacterium]|nr:MAG: hypothetical protein EOO71_16220 [Myxococcaceae bacterium]